MDDPRCQDGRGEKIHGARQSKPWSLIVPVLLFLEGIVLGLAGVVDWEKVLQCHNVLSQDVTPFAFSDQPG